MREQIEMLLQLRQLDDAIQALNDQIRAREADLQRKVMEENLVRETLAQEKTKLRACEARHRDADQRVDSCREQKKHFEKQLHDVKTNTEYHALLREIAGVEKKANDLEEVALECMEQEEAGETHIRKLEREAGKKGKVTEELRGEVEREKAAAGKQVVKLRGERAGLIATLKASVRSKYERLLKTKGETAIVAVVDGSCGGCHYSLPPRVGAQVRRGDQMVLCEGCGRILVGIQAGAEQS